MLALHIQQNSPFKTTTMLSASSKQCTELFSWTWQSIRRTYSQEIYIFLYIKATKLLLCCSFRRWFHLLCCASDIMTGCIFMFFSRSTFLSTSHACGAQAECHCKKVLFSNKELWSLNFADNPTPQIFSVTETT